MWFGLSLFMAVVLFAALGWSTYAVMQRGGPELERCFRAARGLMIAGVFFCLIFAVNYILASTGLKRVILAEPVVARKHPDPLVTWFFSGSELMVYQLWAALIVASSFICVGVFLKQIKLYAAALRQRLWATDPVGFSLATAKFAFTAVAAAACLWLDTALLIFRSATLMWMAKYCTTPASLPDPSVMITQNGGTMGAFLLVAFRVFYPVTILMADVLLASNMAFYVESLRHYAAAKARAEQLLNAPAAPQVLPGLPVVPGPVAAPPAPAGVAGAGPGGAAPWVQPIPFNPGPRVGGNGGRPAGGLGG